MKIFIGNLNTTADEKSLKGLFMPYGVVTSSTIAYDGYTRRCRGYGYVEIESFTDGQSAIARLNNTIFMKQSIIVREAESKGSPTSGGRY